MNKIIKPITITLGMLCVPALGGNVTIEREYDKEMQADRGPVLNELDRIERVHAMTPHDAQGVPVQPWFAGVKHGTLAGSVPRPILNAGPWCSDCGRRLQLRTLPWGEEYLHCLSCAQPATWVKIEPFKGSEQILAKYNRVFGPDEKYAEALGEFPTILEEANHILADMQWIEDENPRRPIDPVQPLRWWKRMWKRIVEFV